MFFEARNKNGGYPFDVFNSADRSSDSIQVVNSISDIRLFIRTDGHLAGYLTEVSSTDVILAIYRDSQLLANCICSFDGNIQGPSIIDTRNSFIKFCSTPVIGTYNLPLLAQTLCYIPKGLYLFCQRNQITRTAQDYNYDPAKCYLYKDSVRFLQGKNCQVFTQDGIISFSGSANNGLGKFTQTQVNTLLDLQSNIKSERQRRKSGLLSVNGQYPNIFLQTLGQLELYQIPGKNSLTIQIQRENKQEQ